GRPKDEEGAQEAEKKIREIAQKLKAGEETFETLASRASDDLETASRGGIVGWITKDMPLPPEFLATAFSLAKGTVSEPFRTALGWHIVKVLDVQVARELDFTNATLAGIIRRMVVGRKMDAYLQQEMAKAHIEVVGAP
ncbi:MAG: peptidylprolyl isomerase, partial [Planctomycetota bacterium]